jgi:hypothetical protein
MFLENPCTSPSCLVENFPTSFPLLFITLSLISTRIRELLSVALATRSRYLSRVPNLEPMAFSWVQSSISVRKKIKNYKLPGLPFLILPDLRSVVDVYHQLGEDLRGRVIQPEAAPHRREVGDGVHHFQHPAGRLPVLAQGLQQCKSEFIWCRTGTEIQNNRVGIFFCLEIRILPPPDSRTSSGFCAFDFLYYPLDPTGISCPISLSWPCITVMRTGLV